MFNRNRPNHLNRPNRPKLGGFTIAEMIIVVMILAILSTVGYRTYFDERDRFLFNNSLSKTLQLIQTARAYAISSQPVLPPGGTKNIVPPDGYGIKVQLDPAPGKSMITVFANLGTAADKYFEPGDPNPDRARLDGNDVVLETFTLPAQITFKSFFFQGLGSQTFTEEWIENPASSRGPTALEADIIFRPPLAEATVTGFRKATPNTPVPLEAVALKFSNPTAPVGSAKQCQRITFDRVKMFPELTYDNCL